MKKLHKVSYAEIFGGAFRPDQIDGNLKNLEIEEKLYLLDNIVDYLYYNFKLLRAQDEENKEILPKKVSALAKQQQAIELAMAQRLIRKGINPSLSLEFKKVIPMMVIGGQPLREIKRQKEKVEAEMLLKRGPAIYKGGT